MRAARIENGVVADLWEVPSLDCYGDLYHLVEAPGWVQIGATWDGANFQNPPPDPAIERQIALDMIMTSERSQVRALRELVLSLVEPGSVPPEEVAEAKTRLLAAESMIRAEREKLR